MPRWVAESLATAGSARPATRHGNGGAWQMLDTSGGERRGATRWGIASTQYHRGSGPGEDPRRPCHVESSQRRRVGGVLRRRNTVGRSLRIVGGSSGGGWPPRSGGSFPGRLRRPPDAEPDRTYDPTPKNQIFWDFSVKKVPAAPVARHPGWPDQGSWSPPPSTPAGAPSAPTPTPAARVPHRSQTPSAATSRCLFEPRQGW